MTPFEKHMNLELSKKTINFLENTSLTKLKEKAQRLAFQSKCPVALVDDSPELRDQLMKASELIEKFIKFNNQ